MSRIISRAGQRGLTEGRQLSDAEILKLIASRDGPESALYRAAKEVMDEKSLGVSKVAESTLPTVFGEFRIHVFRASGHDYPVLTKGDVSGENVLVLVHSQCLTGDTFGCCRCECGPQLRASQMKIQKEGKGVIVYIPHHEGRGIGIAEKIKAFALQDVGADTIEANLELGHPADDRDFGDVPQILRLLGVKSPIRLLTNNPAKIHIFDESGFELVREPLEIPTSEFNLRYLKTKRGSMGHMLKQS